MTCTCNGTGVVLVEGPTDAAPLEAPCPCLEQPVLTTKEAKADEEADS
jgi:hypothetical protein